MEHETGVLWLTLRRKGATSVRREVNDRAVCGPRTASHKTSQGVSHLSSAMVHDSGTSSLLGASSATWGLRIFSFIS